MRYQVVLFGIVLISGIACAVSPASSNNAVSPTATPAPYVFDRKKAREVADSMVDALIKNDRPVIYSKSEKAVRDYYDLAAFNETIDKMVGMFGPPIEAKFKKSEQGRKWGAGYDLPMLKHWYAVKTSKFDYGNHFIFVEIVPDGDEGYASSGIAIVKFPLNVPEDMQ